jgi:alpha-L-fucosidase 2
VAVNTTVILWTLGAGGPRGCARGACGLDWIGRMTTVNSMMWYRSAATEWKEGLPIGNGVLAAMVLGSVPEERVALNHEWLWRAKGRFRDTDEKHQHLEEIRRLFFEGKLYEAGNLANERLGGGGGVTRKPNRVDPYQPAGDLRVLVKSGSAADYRRELDLSTATVRVSYQADGATFVRETFAHAARPLICMRQICSKNGMLDARIALDRIADADCALELMAEGETVRMCGRFPEGPRFCVLARRNSRICARTGGG